jgi:multidrug resistance efflux pump
MIVVLLNAYIALLALFVWLRFIPFNTFWKLSPILVLLVLLVGLFIPMGWGAPSGPAAVIRNSVQIVPSVAGEVVDVPVAANTPVKEGDVLFRIDPTTYQAQVQAIEAQLKFAELRLGQFSELQRRDTGRAGTPAGPSTCRSANPKSRNCAPSSTAPGGISAGPPCERRPTAT